MFIGHFAPAFAAAAVSTRAPKLGWLFLAAQLVDWAFFLFAMVGIEKMRIEPGATVLVPLDLYHMPYTHSLLASAIWAIAFGLLTLRITRSKMAGILAGGVVVSHWALDWLTHRPDMTIAGGPEAYGLGLWNFPMIAIPLELGITIGAFIWYLRSTRGPIGQPLILIGVMLALQLALWFGPTPEQEGLGVYLSSLVIFAILTAIAWWVGQNRWHNRARD